MTYKYLYTPAKIVSLMAKNKVRLITAKEYAELKPLVNRYEREWRKRNPKKHEVESKKLLSAILKTRKPKRKTQHKKEVKLVEST